MVTEDTLIEHDRLERLATPRPWFSIIRTSGIYKSISFWSRTPYKEVPFDSPPDIKYLTLIRNIAPDMVKTIRLQRVELNGYETRERQLKAYAESLLVEIELLKEVKILKE